MRLLYFFMIVGIMACTPEPKPPVVIEPEDKTEIPNIVKYYQMLPINKSYSLMQRSRRYVVKNEAQGEMPIAFNDIRGHMTFKDEGSLGEAMIYEIQVLERANGQRIILEHIQNFEGERIESVLNFYKIHGTHTHSMNEPLLPSKDALYKKLVPTAIYNSLQEEIKELYSMQFSINSKNPKDVVLETMGDSKIFEQVCSNSKKLPELFKKVSKFCDKPKIAKNIFLQWEQNNGTFIYK